MEIILSTILYFLKLKSINIIIFIQFQFTSKEEEKL